MILPQNDSANSSSPTQDRIALLEEENRHLKARLIVLKKEASRLKSQLRKAYKGRAEAHASLRQCRVIDEKVPSDQ
jgi:predicted RNase H-like nuclease (RuvC/YqgF family)